MPATDDPLDRFRHDAQTALTVISGHAQLLTRAVRSSPVLTARERATVLAGLTAIRATAFAVSRLLTVALDARERSHPNGHDPAAGVALERAIGRRPGSGPKA